MKKEKTNVSAELESFGKDLENVQKHADDINGELAKVERIYSEALANCNKRIRELEEAKGDIFEGANPTSIEVREADNGDAVIVRLPNVKANYIVSQLNALLRDEFLHADIEGEELVEVLDFASKVGEAVANNLNRIVTDNLINGNE